MIARCYETSAAVTAVFDITPVKENAVTSRANGTAPALSVSCSGLTPVTPPPTAWAGRASSRCRRDVRQAAFDPTARFAPSDQVIVRGRISCPISRGVEQYDMRFDVFNDELAPP